MRIRLPLYARILLWFFLNLAVLGAGFYIFFRAHFRLGLDSLMMGRAGDRIQAVSDLVTFELNRTSRNDWDDILARFSEAYHIRFLLFRNDGSQAAGEPTPLPVEVRERLAGPRGLMGLGVPNVGAGPPAGGGLRRGPGPPFENRDGAPGPVGGRRGPGVLAHAGPPGASQKFMLRTGEPRRYWVGVRLPLVEGDRPRAAGMTLLALSESLSGGGLFLDLTPWIVVGFGAVLLSVVFWIPLVRGITGSVRRISHATEQIAEGKFDVRLVEPRNDELGSLAEGINRMAARLAGFVSGQRRFFGDIAHELCSPIARIQVALGILEQRADEKQRAYIEDLREEVQQMSELINELLSFSKASLGHRNIECGLVDLREIAERAVAREAAGRADVQIDLDAGLRARANQELLLRAVSNLVRNAIRHAGGGPITISGRRGGDEVTLTVADHGPGIPEDQLEKVFDPFYRVDVSRDRETGGVGLGLAIVKTCVESCGGKVRCQNRQPTGLEVVITLAAEPSPRN